MSEADDRREGANFGLTRRQGMTAALGSALAAGLPAAARAAPATGLIAYVGTYTAQGQGVGRGIHAFSFDPEKGTLRPLAVTEGIVNPSWLTISADKRFLYALSEVEDFDGKNGSVTAYRIAGQGRLEKLNTVSSGGAAPAHLSLHPRGTHLFVANYTGGSIAVLPIGQDGKLMDATDLQHGKSGPAPAQAADNPPGNYTPSDHAGSHMHMVEADPAGRFVLANDAGQDMILVWRFDAAAGKLVPAPTPFTAATPGSAPRHFAFDRGSRLFFNLQEQDSMLVAYGFDAITGALARKTQLSTLPAGFAGSNLGSELRLSADGRFLYAGNRLRNSIAIFSVGLDGRLAKVDEVWVQSDYPRSFTLDPSGRFLVCCNQKGDSLTTFAVDRGTGKLRFTGRFTPVGTPVVLAFA